MFVWQVLLYYVYAASTDWQVKLRFSRFIFYFFFSILRDLDAILLTETIILLCFDILLLILLMFVGLKFFLIGIPDFFFVFDFAY